MAGETLPKIDDFRSATKTMHNKNPSEFGTSSRALPSQTHGKRGGGGFATNIFPWVYGKEGAVSAQHIEHLLPRILKLRSKGPLGALGRLCFVKHSRGATCRM